MRLGDLVQIRKGKKPQSISPEPAHGLRRLIQIDDLRPGGIPKYCPTTPDEVMAKKTDVLIAWDGANAATSNFGLSGVIGSTLALLRPTDRNVFTPYLGHFVRANESYLRARCKGATVPHIDSRVLENLDVVLPPLPEQRRIAEILDKADALRAKRRAGLVQLDTLTQSIFLDMFGDPATNPKGFSRARLDALVREDDCINYGVVQPGDDCDGGVPLIRVGDLHDGMVDQSELKRISPSIASAYKRSRLRGDEILVSCVGSTGVIALADDSVKGFNVARAVARIPLDASIDRMFMANYLRTEFIQRYFQSELRTVSQPTLNIKQLSETVVVLPPRELQREFARRVEAVAGVRDRHHKSLKGLDAAFASIQLHAFRGALQNAP